jgi:hypothetical protein
LSRVLIVDDHPGFRSLLEARSACARTNRDCGLRARRAVSRPTAGARLASAPVGGIAHKDELSAAALPAVTG